MADLDLTEREKQVARLLLEGKNARQIGEALGISKKAVDKLKGKLIEKMGFPKTSILAARRAQEQGKL